MSTKLQVRGIVISTVISLLVAIPGVIAFFKSLEKVDLTGDWKLTFYIDSTSYKPYLGKSIDYKIFFDQDNGRVTGKGESWEFNSELKYDTHMPIEFIGKVKKYHFTSTYTLFGALRTTTGSLDVNMKKDGNSFEGVYSGTAANSSGRVTGVRLR